MDTIMRVVARATVRIFIGLPLCHHWKFLDISINYTTDTIKTGLILSMVPVHLKSIVNHLINSNYKTIDCARALLGPTIERRRSMMEQYGDDWPDKPNDLLQWLMEAAEGIEREPRALTACLLMVCFAAIHTSSMSFTHALYRLAVHPEHLQLLREEVEAIVTEDSWSKGSLQKMRKIDSFLKESQRVKGINSILVECKALKDFTFSDGMFILKGSYVSTSKIATHDWRKYYNGLCTKHQMTNTSMEYLPFGIGKHACPGCFYAANKMKSMMAHLVMMYDVHMEKSGEVTRAFHFGSTISPNRTAKVLFRKQKD
ncbi:uncharacterized protein PHACADRAFT_192410 [Phanerochaete carnosa HHB-10118-sp]|uniref:Cytochrome P450 n=1 Tax=Phanerochaete carnosa (strain HHB-10118-sp) TaxID=650164 RepID=K5XAQ1_PHACS|nr:uncharacterized protein PHACADRAFT_192410 [Phanerochaete carnosa HHB-10118-sp]EKM60012.1 hypothetical protein PHACADRAFT_192410 [Phanerochaete carnosa HHB-10118-sp]